MTRPPSPHLRLPLPPRVFPYPSDEPRHLHTSYLPDEPPHAIPSTSLTPSDCPSHPLPDCPALPDKPPPRHSAHPTLTTPAIPASRDKPPAIRLGGPHPALRRTDDPPATRHRPSLTNLYAPIPSDYPRLPATRQNRQANPPLAATTYRT